MLKIKQFACTVAGGAVLTLTLLHAPPRSPNRPLNFQSDFDAETRWGVQPKPEQKTKKKAKEENGVWKGRDAP